MYVLYIFMFLYGGYTSRVAVFLINWLLHLETETIEYFYQLKKH